MQSINILILNNNTNNTVLAYEISISLIIS